MSQSDAIEMKALRARFPKPSLATVAFLALNIVAMNAYLLYLVLQHESSQVAIAVYSVLELVILSVITNVTLTGVPRELRVGSPDMPILKHIIVIVVMSAFLSGIFWLSVGSDREHIDQLRNARNPLDALSELHVLQPLLVMAGLAVFGAIGDRLRWQRSGGPFVSGAALSAAPKFMTALVGPFVAAMLSAAFGESNDAKTAVVWCVIFLTVKSAVELPVLAWQFRGMPERNG